MNKRRIRVKGIRGFINLSSATWAARNMPARCSGGSQRRVGGGDWVVRAVDHEPAVVEICEYRNGRVQRYGCVCTPNPTGLGQLLMEMESDAMQLHPHGREIQSACRYISC